MKYPITVDLLTPENVKAFKLYTKKLGSADIAARTVFAAGLHAVAVVGGMARVAEDMLAERLAKIVELDAILADRLAEVEELDASEYAEPELVAELLADEELLEDRDD